MKPNEFIKNRRTEQILKTLNERPKKFREIAIETKLHDMTVSREIKHLLENKIIKKVIYGNHEAYQLTKKGQDYLKGMWMILYEIYEMQNRKTNYDSNYFSENDIKYSLLREVESPYVNYNSFIKKISNEYRELTLKSIKENYIKENRDNTYSLINKEELKGKHIIALEIDFDLIRKNIEDALKSDKEFVALLKDYKEGISVAKEDKRNLYRHILLKEERKPILEQESDREDDPQ